MIKKNNPSDRQSFQQTIIQLDQGLSRGWASTLVEIATVLAAIAAAIVLRNQPVNTHADLRLVADGFLLLILACNVYRVVQYNQLKSVPNRLAEQLKISVKERVRADKLYDLAILDPLTGLHNRRFGEERLKEEIARADRNGEPLAVLVLDLDHFKEINDQFGHAVGDAALKEFSRSLRKAIRACDVPVRIGGDEFLVILPDCPREKVDTILSRVGSPKVKGPQRLSIPYSVGRSHYQVNDTIKTLLARADEVLYAEKKTRHQNSRRSEPLIRSTLAYNNQEQSVASLDQRG
jgi:diguanylate cyclase (GGDEF)-like protein